MRCPKHPRYTGQRKPRRDCPTCWMIYENTQLQKKTNRLEIQIDEMKQQKRITTKQYFGSRIRFGVVSDTHLGSLYERPDVLNLAYEIFQKEGIKAVYHSGDIVDGESMYKGQEYEISIHGADAQVRHCVEEYPSVDGIKTYFILGNHCLSFWNKAGIDIGEKIASERNDMFYLGKEEADIEIGSKGKKCILRLVHPGGGTAYAISYHIQKYINSLTGGEKPNIIIQGHFHKAEYLFYRNIHTFQAGCIQSQTPYMRRKRVPAMVGFWIIEVVPSEDGIERCQGEFFPYYH